MTGIVPPGQGHLLTARGNEMVFKAVAEQTAGDFSLMERTVPPGARTPPPHRHVTCSEAFFVLAGTVTFRLDDTERVSFGPLSHYQPIVGDDAGSTPVRTGIQTAQPGYAAPVHSHPYIEILHILDGVAEAWIDGRPDSLVVLRKGDTIAVPPETPHAFRVVGDQVLRLLGTHVSPKRIVNYQDGVTSDARGYRSEVR